MSKGIRLNSLAKELGVENKAILQRLRDEGLGDAAPNHMSMLQIGLAETIREWHREGKLTSAAEPATDTSTAVAEKPAKAKPSRSKKKATDTTAEAPPAAQPATEATPEAPESPESHDQHKPKRPARKHKEPEVPAVQETAAPVVEAEVGKPVVVPAAEPTKPPVPTVEHPPVVAPPAVPAVTAPVAPPVVAPPVAAAPEGKSPVAHPPRIAPGSRPTVSINKPAAPAKPTVIPAPQVVPQKAVIQGPRVVREEKPDIVPTPRSRGPRQSEGGVPPAFTPSRPQGGRGVRTTTTDDDDDESDEKKAKDKKGAAGRTNSTRRRGLDGRRGDADTKIKEFTEADLIERSERLAGAGRARATFDSHLKKTNERGHHTVAKSVSEKGEPVVVEEPITVRSLSSALGVKVSDIIGKLMKQGTFATVNQVLDRDLAGVLALEYGIELEIAEQKSLEDLLVAEFEAREKAYDPKDLVSRPPVVTILGHVDHGKTSLLDKIRNANVAAGEAGGITQHTAAWMVEVGAGDAKKRVTFIDTPGHQAFAGMRARGANMTDVVVLVVGAVEGVMPQTIESINHARAAEVPIVVAMNKIDRSEAQPDMVLGQLAKEELNPVEWGGTTEVVRTSAVSGQGIKELIEILDYQSELLDLKANPKAQARGTVVESRMDPGLGPVATVLVQDGTLKVGDIMLAGPGYGRIRSLLNDRGEMITAAGPSTPVIVAGLGGVPSAGDKFFVVDDIDRARAIAEERASQMRQAQLAAGSRVTAENLIDSMKATDVSTINLIIKGDVQGSVETLVASVTGQNTDEVKVRVIHSGVGPVSESDVQLAIATKQKATDNRVSIIAFHVAPEEAARVLAEQNHIEIREYRVIYEIFDDLKKALSGMLEPEIRVKLHGHAEIRNVFKYSKVGSIAGCIITDGHILRGSKIRLIRNGVVITEDLSIESLRRIKDDVKEAKMGMECGIKLAGYDDIKEGDVLEGYVKETIERTL